MTETTTTPAPLRVTTGGPIYEPAPSVELESLAADVDREYRAHAATVKPLGKPGDWLTPAEHARRVAAADDKLQAELDSIWERATAKADARLSRARAERAAQDIEPWERLDPVQLQRAAGLLPFVASAVAGATLREVAAALTVRASGKDPALAATWLHVAYGRLAEARAGASADSPVPGLIELESAIRNAVELVDGPQVVKARERAVAAEEAAATLRSGIDGLKIQRDPATGRANADRYGVRYIPYTPPQ